jgi:addiction module HigA family antidote
MDSNGMRSIHSAEALEHELLEPSGAAGADLAGPCPDSEVELTKLVAQSAGVSPDLARKLAVHFNTTPDFWLNLQSHYEARSDDIERG